MPTWDVRNFDDETREKLAWKVRNLPDYNLPTLSAWDYNLCPAHEHGWIEVFYVDGEPKRHMVYDRPPPECRKCGIRFRKHQRVGIMWMYLKKRALLADTMGLGKTAEAGGVIAMLLETGELSLRRDTRSGGVGRVIVVPTAAALDQWRKELLRMMPGLNIIVASGGMTQAQRVNMYLTPWQVLLIGPEMMRNDYSRLERLDIAALFADDVDALRHSETDTSYAMDRIGRRFADRYYIMNGTPLQKKLPELYNVLDGVGGEEVFASADSFEKTYVRKDTVTDFDKYGKQTRKVITTGYKNGEKLKAKMAPMVLRRTAEDLDDVSIPVINPVDVFLDLYPRQRAKYEELRRDVIQIMKETGTETKRLTALSKIHYGSAICAGLAALGEEDEPLTSVKLDWVIDKTSADGDLGEEKVVVFVKLKNTVRALQSRLQEAGTGFVTIWGDDRKNRPASIERFNEDPRCRILIGTTAIERSLNLQISRHMINVDMILNQARMAQLAGRVARVGSSYPRVFIHNLLTTNTQEARYLEMLEREAAVASYIWDEESPLFKALDPMALMHLITG